MSYGKGIIKQNSWFFREQDTLPQHRADNGLLPQEIGSKLKITYQQCQSGKKVKLALPLPLFFQPLMPDKEPL
ncbi:MAG: hypothetical protein U5L72_19495 [Bacteroidales bacterium]|nr:hypothetical protein [Bacteroidales bacterium]